ncbi:CBS domain-containing protein [Fulvimonas sp. R45]|uniref:CBS domain-containing protein n=1 Tax=Fulvimonas sp. R45 TaxID=3045937 RepID=UPI0026603696|nr:CBS domain-containing protein [Fulvimonas sp. R45]MDO1527242.1 CBS domain-containing protein [Fulvimonas sp. R45]
MQASDIMTRQPSCCSPGDPLPRAARIMLEEDVGEVPVVDEGKKLLGVITDRDIVTRCVAVGDSAQAAFVDACMTAPALWLTEDATLEEVADLMADQAIRRVPIVDHDGRLSGIVALADLDSTDARSLKARVVESVSVPH